jgi:hypothetical protein
MVTPVFKVLQQIVGYLVDWVNAWRVTDFPNRGRGFPAARTRRSLVSFSFSSDRQVLFPIRLYLRRILVGKGLEVLDDLLRIMVTLL